MQIYRYPGVQPFGKEQSKIFFGRTDEAKELLEKINIEQLIVLFGKSGLGKSSLINAGIIPELEASQDILPIPVRFGVFNKVDHRHPLDSLKQPFQLKDAPACVLDKILPKENSLWYFVKKFQINRPEISRVILIFDQFEEIFTFPEKEVLDFKRELSEVLFSAIPPRFREKIEEKFHEDDNFFDADETEILHRPLKIKLLTAIRSDRLSLLNSLTDYFPDILSKCYELKPLDNRSAEDAILNPAYLSGEEFTSPQFDYSDEAIESILNYLTKYNTESVESFQLQILCHYIERKVIEQNLQIVTMDTVGDLGEIYENYYENQILLLPTEEERTTARILLEEGLIFEEEERRLSLYEGQIQRNFNISEDLLAKLVDSRLIRPEPSQRGGFIYEISHDTIVPSILRAKKKRLEQERKEEEQHLLIQQAEQIKQLQEKAALERKKRLRAIIYAVAGLLLAAVSIVATFIAIEKNRSLNEEKAKVEKAYTEVQKAQQKGLEALFLQFIANGDKEVEAENFAQAIEHYKNAQDIVLQFDETFEGQRQLVLDKIAEARNRQNASDNFNQLIVEGDQLLARGENFYRQVLDTYTAARKLNFDNSLAENKIQSVKLKIESAYQENIEKARAYFNVKQYELAKKYFSIASRLKPEDQYARNQIANCNKLIQ